VSTRQLSLMIAGRPMLANDGGHWAAKASAVAGVRLLASLAGRGQLNDEKQITAEWSSLDFEGIRHYSSNHRAFHLPVTVHAYGIQPTSAKRWIDADASAPMVKAVLDGLVDAKLLEDDGPRFVRSYHYDIARRGPAWATVVEIRETDGEESCPW